MRSVCASANTFTMPLALPKPSARPLAPKPDVPFLYAMPAAFSCSSVLPTHAISGSVYTTNGTLPKSTCGFCPAMRSATATPSSLALCASIGPRTTSPIAHTLGKLVRHSSSTAIKPRSSIAKPTFSAPKPCVTGTRPMAIISLSNCAVLVSFALASPVLASLVFRLPETSYSTDTPSLYSVIWLIFTPKSIASPCSWVKYLNASLAICRSAAGKKVGAASKICTCAPKRFHTEPISKPITPAPMIPSFFGISVRFSAPSLSNTFTLLIGARLGKPRGAEPVAMITCLAAICAPLSTFSSHSSPALPANEARPKMLSILFF